MTFRLSMIAAALLISATAAFASTAPTTTDEARAVAGAALPSSEGPATVTTTRTASTSDEARAIAGRALPKSTVPAAVATVRFPITTDEARAASASRARATGPMGGQKAAVACHHDCPCSRG